MGEMLRVFLVFCLMSVMGLNAYHFTQKYTKQIYYNENERSSFAAQDVCVAAGFQPLKWDSEHEAQLFLRHLKKTFNIASEQLIHINVDKHIVLKYDVDWALNEPHNGNCIAIHMESNGYSSLSTIDCGATHPFFCQTENKSFERRSLGLTSNRAKNQKNVNQNCQQKSNEVNSTSNFYDGRFY